MAIEIIGSKPRDSVDAAHRAVMYEEGVEKKDAECRKRQHPVGHYKHLSGLMESRRIACNIPNGFFEQQMVFDRIMIFQLPDEDGGKYGDTSIVKPAAVKSQDERTVPKGVLVGGGLKAMDNLASNGIQPGHVVYFIKNAPWRMKVDCILGENIYGLIMRDGDITGSEELSQALSSGEAKIEAKGYDRDGVTIYEHFYTDPEGRTWAPGEPFTDESM